MSAIPETFRILSRGSTVVCFECELPDEIIDAAASVKLGFAVKKAIESNADLRGANLRGADLSIAYLSGADLSGANLSGADLSMADLGGANLSGADLSMAYLRDAYLRDAYLRDAYLREANLSEADLSGANLSGAYLHRADLSGANLSGAYLSGAYLSGAYLQIIRENLFEVLKSAPAEAAGFLEVLKAGRVDGSVYKGNCACLVGTIANLRGVHVSTLPQRADSPIERFVLGIAKGDTPETSPIAKLVAEWTEEFLKETI